MNSLELAYLHLLRRKLPTALGVLSLAISIGVAGLLFRVYEISQDRYHSIAKAGNVVIGAKAGAIEILLGSLNGEGVYPDFLPENIYRTMRVSETKRFADGEEWKAEPLEAVVPLLVFGKWRQFRAVGTNVDFFSLFTKEYPEVAVSGKSDFGVGEIVLGSSVALVAKAMVGETLSIRAWSSKGEGSDRNFKVVGILSQTSSAWDRTIFGSLTDAQEIVVPLSAPSIWKEHVLNYIFLKVKSAKMASLESMINDRSVGQWVNVQDAKEKLQSLTGTGGNLELLITSLIGLLGVLNVVTLISTRFDSMQEQLAVLLAIGYSKCELASWLLWENLLIALAACILGAAIDWALLPVVRSFLGSALPAPEIVDSSIWKSSPIWVGALAANGLVVLLPMLRVFRQDVNSTLRGL